MKTLVIGNGGREHAITLALERDPSVTEVHAAPGNPGMAAVAILHPVDPLSPQDVTALAVKLRSDLVIVGPEAPLVAGVADAVRASGIACFGPSQQAAQLEASKTFAKDVMTSAGVATARSLTCASADEAERAFDEFGAPYVVKDDGLAGGKGVVVTDDRPTAHAHAAQCDRFLIEECLVGPEVSLFGVTDGTTVVPLQPAQDFKRVGDGDTGLNTGGMGAYSPLPWAPDDLVETVTADVLQPTVDEMARRGIPFQGLLYAGLALTSQGVRVVEFNARFGDPETQALLALMEPGLGALLYAAATGSLADVRGPRWRSGAAVTVVVAAENYPDRPVIGDIIDGVEHAGNVPGVDVLHAGTAVDSEGCLVTAGGRVLSVTAVGTDVGDARRRAYDAVELIEFRGSHHRGDIAARAAERIAT